MDVAWTRIGAYVVCRDEEGRVLLTRFSLAGHPDAGGWTLPGGSLEWGESSEEAALRELTEESGLIGELGPILGTYSRWYDAREAFDGVPGHHFGVIYAARVVAGELRATFEDDDTTDDAGWLTLDQIRRLPLVPLAEYALRFVS